MDRSARPVVGASGLALVENDGKVHVEPGVLVLHVPLRHQVPPDPLHLAGAAPLLGQHFLVELVGQVPVLVKVHRPGAVKVTANYYSSRHEQQRSTAK